MEMLGAITGLIGAGLQAKAQADAQQVAWANLMFQKQQAAEQQRFASAARSDAYGNKTSYNDILNEWKTILTPVQNQIMKAGEQEQLRSVTEDAQRNRRQKERAEQTALLAGDEFGKALAGFKYDQPKSELATRDDLEKLLIGSDQEQRKENQALVGRQALRMGKGADYAKIIKATDDAMGQNLPDLMVKAYDQARTQHGQDVAQHSQQYLPELQNWEQLMAQGGGDAALRFSNAPQEINAIQGNMANAIQSAMQSGASGINSAYNSVATAVGKSPDLSKIAGGFNKMAAIDAYNAKKAPKYSMTQQDPDANRQPWDANLPWGDTGGYLNNMDYGDWLF